MRPESHKAQRTFELICERYPSKWDTLRLTNRKEPRDCMALEQHCQ